MAIDSHKSLNHSSRMNAVRKLQPFWRVAALIALIGWITAFAICSAHCALGQTSHLGESGSEALPPCHGGPTSKNSDSSSEKATSFCITIKSLFSEATQLVLQPPDALALFQPAFAFLCAPDSAALPAEISRPSRPPDFLFTPEVYLGPAFRIHAPPSI